MKAFFLANSAIFEWSSADLNDPNGCCFQDFEIYMTIFLSTLENPVKDANHVFIYITCKMFILLHIYSYLHPFYKVH